jgi:hypothetical protein
MEKGVPIMIRFLLLTAALDLTGVRWDGVAAPLFDDDASLLATSPALWLVVIGLACMATASGGGGDSVAGTRRLSIVRVLA